MNSITADQPPNPQIESDRATSMLAAGSLPVEDLALLADREGWRPRPIYQAHKWFARRFGSAFRALLTAAALPPDGDFWRAYYDGSTWDGGVVLDPFVGGGTSVVEAQRLGARAIGVDIDAVATAITRFELGARSLPDLSPHLDALKAEVGGQLSRYYQTVGPNGEAVIVLHYFWVQILPCRSCGEVIEAHPHYRLAYDARRGQQWVFCPDCHDIQLIATTQARSACARCGYTFDVQVGTVTYGRITCPHCQTSERLIDVAARVGTSPQWQLFALEVLDGPVGKRSTPLAERSFRTATDFDRSVFADAQVALDARRRADGSLPMVPTRAIPRAARADNRLTAYGYDSYAQLFNPRQLLHLSTLAESIAALSEPERTPLALAFSDHLATNCMMTSYAFGWRRLSPLFSIRAYRHIPRPVELNPWLDGTGRGTFPNAVRQVQRAIAFAKAPQEASLDGGFQPSSVSAKRDGEQGEDWTVWQRNAQDLSPIATASVDLVLTDPPYFDNIAYAELSDFYLPWMQLLGLVPDDGRSVTILGNNLSANRRDQAAAEAFSQGMDKCFAEMARVLKPTGELVLTFQHRSSRAWIALATALATAGFRVIQLFPLRGDHRSGPHAHPGSSTWDAVFVARHGESSIVSEQLRLSEAAFAAAMDHAWVWTDRLSKAASCRFEPPDRCNLQRAAVVAAALGMFAHAESAVEAITSPIDELLGTIAMDTTVTDRRP